MKMRQGFSFLSLFKKASNQSLAASQHEQKPWQEMLIHMQVEFLRIFVFLRRKKIVNIYKFKKKKSTHSENRREDRARISKK